MTFLYLAVTMPNISHVDIDACKRQKDSRSTEALLRIWGSKGYRVDDLYKIFGMLKMVKCMQVIREYGWFLIRFLNINFDIFVLTCFSGSKVASVGK